MTAQPATIRELLRKLLVPMWLRPERALWDAHYLEALGRLLPGTLPAPSLELGCTDGVPTFVLLGGEFEDAFDDYDAVDTELGARGLDYFDRATPEEGDRRIARRPDRTFDVGVSWRSTQISRARRLDLYRSLHEVDHGGPLPMCGDGQFRTVLATNLFWESDVQLEASLAEIGRVLHPGGALLTILPDADQASHLLLERLRRGGEAWAARIDRGIADNSRRQARPLADWVAFLRSHGLEIRHHERFLPSTVSLVYQLGLRPMFPVLIDMYRRLRAASPEGLLDLKRHWMATVFDLLSPLCDPAALAAAGACPLWHAFKLGRAV